MFKANSELCINCPKMSSVIYPRWRYLRTFLWAIFFVFCWFQTVLFLVWNYSLLSYQMPRTKNISILKLYSCFHIVYSWARKWKRGGGINEMFIHESSLLNILSETKDCMKKCCDELQESWIFRLINCLD